MILNGKRLILSVLALSNASLFANASSKKGREDSTQKQTDNEESQVIPTPNAVDAAAGDGVMRGLKKGRGVIIKSTKDKKERKIEKSKNAKVPKAGKASKSSKKANAKGDLQVTLSDAIAAKDQLQKAFNCDQTAAELCRNSSDDHQHCIYDILTPGSDFMCECRPTGAGRVFEEVDANGDGFITLEDVLIYFKSEPCEFPFKYTFEGVTNTYNNCTSDFDNFGFSWCSIRTLADGNHADGFWKYCDEASNVFAWKDALARLDSDGDGKLAFDEGIINARRRRNLLAHPGDIGTEYNCNDCEVSDDCKNPVVRAIDGECRNYIKTKPLGNETLLRILGSAMSDVYCDKGPYTPDDGGPLNYYNCERKRGGMEKWITRDETSVVYPNVTAVSIVQLLLCAALVQGYKIQTSVEMVTIYDSITWLNPAIDVVSQCEESIRHVTDGKDALQYAVYTIGPEAGAEYEGKKILAYAGTDFDNIEHIYADLVSTPLASDMIKTMANEAKDAALEIKPDYITGHSLGGIIAEMVCSMTGIKGASFGAIGAFDPFTRLDEKAINNLSTSHTLSAINGYKKTLSNMGYDDEDVAELISTLDPRDLLIQLEYNGLIMGDAHNGIEFEVVMNAYDIPARTISSIDGSACSHIASSCDLRWTWFGGEGLFDHTFGHSSAQYNFNSISKWTRGYDHEENIDYSKIFLPKVTKNVACDFCDRNEYCKSGSCDVGREQCFGAGGKYPTYCPNNSHSPNTRTDCDKDIECVGRCESHSNPAWALSGYGQCYDKLGKGAWCNEHSDCKSDKCNWFFQCSGS